ncbi:sensor histidine kinase [Sulfuricystis multivorans]|uniref:sensor histidine kinase n=1 Tax=Sulfuricystis multivorans TaxID=2211108 RepID=UPI000F8366EF|nr:HAMP domain-containing sensor histidine kinase [Sulfuricystis multivorans]
MRLFDLSLRHKVPLWGSALILAAAIAIGAAYMVRAYDDLKQDVFTSAASLGQTLAQTLFPPLLHDDLWRAFEIVRAPFHEGAGRNPLQPDAIFVLDGDMHILVASDPARLPTLSRLDDLANAFSVLAKPLRARTLTDTQTLDLAGAHHFFTAMPIESSGRRLGTLVVAHDRDVVWARFLALAVRGALIGLLALAALLPINWYWGRRMAEPLVELSKGMDALVHGRPLPMPAAERYSYRDELGRLFAAYREAAVALNEKAMLEKEMLHAERLAAVGRLAAGIAHEINNPLGGMLMALDTLKQRGPLDAATAKTVALLERGLQQVAEIVGALLVEARVASRPLDRHDFEDVRTLIEPQLVKKQLMLDWHVNLPERLALPASVVRQILINLLLNAVQATDAGGHVRLTARADEAAVRIEIANSGKPLPEAVRSHLFEPFVSGREDGHGLGLWVTYQTVTQLAGQIEAGWQDGEMRFTVTLPLEAASA